MKTNAVWMAAVVLLAAPAGAEEKAAAGQLPEPVQKAIDASRGGDPVKKVVRREVGGRIVYEVEIERKNTVNARLRIAEDGTILRDTRRNPTIDTSGEPVPFLPSDGIPPDVAAYPKLRLEDLPPAVQETVLKAGGGREIADIDREIWSGRPIYEIEFKQRGFNPQIQVAEDGAILKEERPPKGLIQWFKGTQIEDTPLPVQETIKREVGDRRITDIDKELRSGRPIYEVSVRDADGSFELHIGEDGRVLSDSRKP